MYYQQTQNHIHIRDKVNMYSDTYENAEKDGFVIPPLDPKYDYQIYEKHADGTHKRHALIANHGEISDDGGENWQPGEDAFSDLAELCKRRARRVELEERFHMDYHDAHIENWAIDHPPPPPEEEDYQAV